MLFKRRQRLQDDRFAQLLSYFKFLVTLTYLAIALVVAVGVWFLGRNLEDVRTTAERTATDQAKSKVEVLFKQPNIQKMVDAAADKVVKESLQSTFKEQIERARSSQSDPIIANFLGEAINKAKDGRVDGLLDVQKVFDDPKIPEAAKYSARSIYDNMVKDFEAQALSGDTSITGLLMNFGIDPNNEKKVLIGNLIKALTNPRSAVSEISELAKGYIAIRKLTGVHFTLFDRQAIERWHKNNPTKSLP